MIRISKKYLTKIIREESARALNEVAFFDEEGEVDYRMQDDADPPEHEVVSDEILTHIYETIAAHLGLPSAHNDPAGVMVDVELETEEEFLDTILALVQKGMHVARHEMEREENMLQMRMDKKGKRNFGGNKEDADLMQEEGMNIQKMHLKKGRCSNPGDKNCPKGSPQYNLAMRMKSGDIHKANLKKGKNPDGPG